MATSKSRTINPGIILVTGYVILFAVNALVILLANIFFPQNVVLGTLTLSRYWALALSAGKLALINTFIIPFVNQYEANRGKPMTANEWMVIYLVVNFAGLWLIARFAHIFGLGLSSFWVALILAVVLDLVQGIAMMQLEKYRTQSV